MAAIDSRKVQAATLLFLPGLMCDARIFAAQLDRFPDAVAVDGFGTLRSITDMAQKALATAPGQLSLVGHSMGARVAIEAYRLAPERIERIALLSTGVHPVRASEPAARHELIDLGRTKGVDALIDRWLPPMVAPERQQDESLMTPLRAMCRDVGVDAFAAQVEALLGRPDAQAVLPTITCPTLVAVGAEDRWSPPAQHSDIAAAVPGASAASHRRRRPHAPGRSPRTAQCRAGRLAGLAPPIRGETECLTRACNRCWTTAATSSNCCATSRPAPTPIPAFRPNIPTGATSSRAGPRPACCSTRSYHMVDLEVSGPDAFAMLNHLGINSFKGFVPDRAKQFVPVTPDGYVIGDVILFYLEENRFNLVGRAPVIEWVEYHAADRQMGRHGRSATSAPRSAPDPENRKSYRFQLQGPNAMKTLEKAMGADPARSQVLPHDARSRSPASTVRALRHGMAGQPGYELFGPWADGETVRQALIAAGKDFGLTPGRRPRLFVEHARIGLDPLAAAGDLHRRQRSKAYREWLTAKSYEGNASIGGSFVPDSIEDYYLTPWDLGYGPFVKFDHDFIGREALEKMADQPHRKKVTLALDNEDVMRVMSSALQKGDRAKFYGIPVGGLFDAPVRSGAGRRQAGRRCRPGSATARTKGEMLTLAMLDADYAEPGTKVTLLWGEPDGGTRKPTVERHVQTEIRATVASVPYSEVARDSYADSWRTRQPA